MPILDGCKFSCSWQHRHYITIFAGRKCYKHSNSIALKNNEKFHNLRVIFDRLGAPEEVQQIHYYLQANCNTFASAYTTISRVLNPLLHWYIYLVMWMHVHVYVFVGTYACNNRCMYGCMCLVYIPLKKNSNFEMRLCCISTQCYFRCWIGSRLLHSR